LLLDHHGDDRSANVPDDCDELTTLRRFRDSVLLRTPAGRCEVAE
jgi:hypothetical protein